jgi:Putative citrate transport
VVQPNRSPTSRQCLLVAESSISADATGLSPVRSWDAPVLIEGCSPLISRQDTPIHQLMSDHTNPTARADIRALPGATLVRAKPVIARPFHEPTAWGALTIAPLAIFQGVPVALTMFVRTALAEYARFILLLVELYTVAGGILVTGTIHTSRWNNTGRLLCC